MPAPRHTPPQPTINKTQQIEHAWPLHPCRLQKVAPGCPVEARRTPIEGNRQRLRGWGQRAQASSGSSQVDGCGHHQWRSAALCGHSIAPLLAPFRGALPKWSLLTSPWRRLVAAAACAPPAGSASAAQSWFWPPKIPFLPPGGRLAAAPCLPQLRPGCGEQRPQGREALHYAGVTPCCCTCRLLRARQRHAEPREGHESIEDGTEEELQTFHGTGAIKCTTPHLRGWGEGWSAAPQRQD